jgi:hypothetical protein
MRDQPASATKSGLKRLGVLVVEFLLEHIPGAKSLFRFVKREARGVKDGWVLFIVLLACGGGLTYCVTHKLDIATARKQSSAEKRKREGAEKERDRAKADLAAASRGNSGFKSSSQIAQRRETIKALSKVLPEGIDLEKRFASNNPLPTIEDLNNWGGEVLTTLSSPDLGEAYIARFNSSDSQPGLEGVGIDGHTMEEAARWKWVKKRNATLREFIRELSMQ